MLRPHCPQRPGLSNGRGLTLASLTPAISFGLLFGLWIGLSSCIPRWDKCGSNDFTCDTGMQLLSFAPGSVVMVGGYQTSIPAYAVSLDDGDTWSLGTLSGSGSTQLNTMNFADGRFLAGTGQANFFETRDNGKTWSLIPTDSGSQTSGVGHADGQYIVHDTYNLGTVRAMPDGGSTWTVVGNTIGSTNSPSIVSAGGRLYILAQGNGLYYHTSPTWTTVGALLPYSLCTDSGMIYVAAGNQLYAAQVGSTSFAPVGSTFTPGPAANNSYMACHGSTFVVPVNGTTCQMAVSTNAGASWSTIDLGCGLFYVTGVAFTGKRYVAATSSGQIFVSDNAIDWRPTMVGGHYWVGIAANQAAFYY